TATNTTSNPAFRAAARTMSITSPALHPGTTMRGQQPAGTFQLLQNGGNGRRRPRSLHADQQLEFGDRLAAVRIVGSVERLRLAQYLVIMRIGLLFGPSD